MNWFGRRWQWAVIGAAIVLILVWLLMPSSRSAGHNWEQVVQGELVDDLVESGEIQAVQALTVSAPFEWRADLQIIDMVPEGAVVEKGDFLVQLDTGFLERELQETESNLESDLAEMRRITAAQRSKQQELEDDVTTASLARDQAKLQIEKLHFESEARREEARLALQKAVISLFEARAKLAAQRTLDSLETAKVRLKIEKGRSRVREAQRQIGGLTLRAPQSGLVVYHENRWDESRGKLKIGDKVNPGEVIIEIPDLSLMEVVFAVNEVDREKIHEALQAELSLEAFPEREFHSAITRIARLAERPSQKSEVKRFEVHATIEGIDPLLKPGMTARVRVRLATYSDAVLVPLTCVFEREGQPVVFPKKKWPKPQVLQIGHRNDLFVAATAGVQPGLDLATSRPEGMVAVRPLGYADYERYLEFREEEYRHHFEELERRGITFDYTRFRREGKKGAVDEDVAGTSAVSEPGAVALPDGRRVQLPAGVAQRLKEGNAVSLEIQSAPGDSAGKIRITPGSAPARIGEARARKSEIKVDPKKKDLKP